MLICYEDYLDAIGYLSLMIIMYIPPEKVTFLTIPSSLLYVRHYAEFAGYWSTTKYLEEVDRENPTKYYDSVTGKHLFTAPIGRTMEEYLVESGSHGWPSLRDEEVNWENVRCVAGGECVSTTGTHLGHNIPDKNGNRYCINLVCIAGQPAEGQE